MNKKRTVAAVCIISNANGEVLVQQRRAGQSYPGYWEFPGGKVESGETPYEAMVRELSEEVGICGADPALWLVRRAVYGTAEVELHFFRIRGWGGGVAGCEGQNVIWRHPQFDEPLTRMLAANTLIWKWLRLPDACLVTAAEIFGVEAFLARAKKALSHSFTALVQLRDKNLPPDSRRQLAFAMRDLTRQARALLVVNDDAQLATEVAADGLHLSSRALMACHHRPDFAWVGASCHDEAQLQQAALLGLDYAVLSPVAKTLTHVAVPPLGWTAFTELVRFVGLPVYALGGMRFSDLSLAQKHGAHGIGMMRQSWAFDSENGFKDKLK